MLEGETTIEKNTLQTVYRIGSTSDEKKGFSYE